jgi:glycerate kinase
MADSELLYAKGLTAAFSILPSVQTLDEAILNSKENLENCVIAVTRLLKTTM